MTTYSHVNFSIQSYAVVTQHRVVLE